MPARRPDVLILGGGIAGLWILDRLRWDGWDAVLLEKDALGAGQSGHSQGILHGGGKYALLGDRGNLEAARSVARMPSVWAAALQGKEGGPDLRAAKVLADRCVLWLPKGAGLVSKVAGALLEHAGLLEAKPVPLAEPDWPEALRGSAESALSVPEAVVDPMSVLSALANRHPGRVLKGERLPEGWSARITVLAAGEANAGLAGASGLMQKRPLRAVMLRGKLPALNGHCVLGSKTALTVTGNGGVWKLGGELSEQLASEEDPGRVRARVRETLGRCLPGLDLAGVETASFRVQRAERAQPGGRRPAGVFAGLVGQDRILAWPTKMVLAPALAEEVLGLVRATLGKPEGDGEAPPLPPAPLAPPPWERKEASWSPVL